jgi:hypothetical protein
MFDVVEGRGGNLKLEVKAILSNNVSADLQRIGYNAGR